MIHSHFLVTQEELIAAEVPIERLSLLSKEEMITFFKFEQDFRIKLQRRVAKLKAMTEELKEQRLCREEKYVTIKNVLFGKSSERRPNPSAATRRKYVFCPRTSAIPTPS